MKKVIALLLAMLLVLACVPSFAEEPVKFSIWVPTDDGVRDAYNSFFWDWLTEQTGIALEVIPYDTTEQAQLMWASREFPDMICGGKGINDNVLLAAALDGDLLDLEEVINEYCPNLKAFYEKNTTLMNGARIDGHLYTLPVQIQDPVNSFRDQWMYYAPWLEEIGKEVPTTMDEVLDVLVAIKEAAGTGTIPADVIPYYTCYDSNVGGQFDVFAAFGVLTGCNKQYTVADKDGNIVYQALNPDIKAPLKWLKKAVALDVLPMDCFVNGWSEYLTTYDNYPPKCFLVTAYSNADTTVKHPMDVPVGDPEKPAYIRSQATQGGNPKHVFTIFNTENVKANVEAVGKMIEFCFEPTTAMTVYYGKQEVGFWWQNEDGTYSIDPNWNGSDYLTNHYLECGPNNRFFCILPSEFYATQYTDPGMSTENTRAWAYKNLYADNLADWDPFVYDATLDEDDTFDMNEYYSNIDRVRKETFTRWITTNADIDAEWDAYVDEMIENGANEWLELKQKAYNMATGR